MDIEVARAPKDINTTIEFNHSSNHKGKNQKGNKDKA